MSSDPFVVQLTDLCRTQRTRAKWTIVPSHAVGVTLGDRLAREGVDWVNLRFVTPFALALDIAAPQMLAEGLDPLPDGLGPSLLMRLLMERPAGAPSYFRPLADQPRMGSALWAAIRELRLAGVSAADLARDAFEDGRKHAELRALLEAYEAHLAACRQADAADVYRTAAVHAAAHAPIAADDILLECADLAAEPPLVRRFLDALPGRRAVGALPTVPGLPIPRRHTNTPRNHQPVASPLSCLLAPADSPEPAPSHRLQLFHAAGREAEVEAVLRRILNAQPPIPLDQAEVACASRDAAAIFWEKAQRLDLPVTVESGIPVAATRPGRALLGAVRLGRLELHRESAAPTPPVGRRPGRVPGRFRRRPRGSHPREVRRHLGTGRLPDRPRLARAAGSSDGRQRRGGTRRRGEGSATAKRRHTRSSLPPGFATCWRSCRSRMRRER